MNDRPLPVPTGQMEWLLEGIKRVPGIRRIPVRGLAILVAEGLLAVLSPPEPATWSGWMVLLLNGLLAGTTAIDGWHWLHPASTATKPAP